MTPTHNPAKGQEDEKMREFLETVSAGPVSNSKAAKNTRLHLVCQVLHNRDFYRRDYNAKEGHTLELVVAEVSGDYAWNIPFDEDQDVIELDDIKVVRTRRPEDGLIHLKLSYKGPNESMGELRKVAAKMIPVESFDDGKRFRCKALKVKYWQTEPYHSFGGKVPAVA